MTTSGPYLTLAQACRRLGVTRKALRLYEEHGLVTPERTGADWRVYGPDQIARLHCITALKSFGFPLTRIAELLAGRLPDLARFLEFQEQAARKTLAQARHATQLLAAARHRLSKQGHLSTDDLIFLTREITMTARPDATLAGIYDAIAAKHLSDDDRATLANNGYAGMAEPDNDWARLHGEAARLMEVGDPTSIEAMDLARRWMTKVFEATGGDRTLTTKIRDVAREVHDNPVFQRASTSSNAMMEFIQKAYGAAIAAGLMPQP